ncbi:hypothetical protein BDZ89DRAFT_1115180 [Hymenopellis radicata]|nr:hypothetical protein BDZ89DRAFT_1115180 [Hymenopellis radicata]
MQRRVGNSKPARLCAPAFDEHMRLKELSWERFELGDPFVNTRHFYATASTMHVSFIGYTFTAVPASSFSYSTDLTLVHLLLAQRLSEVYNFRHIVDLSFFHRRVQETFSAEDSESLADNVDETCVRRKSGILLRLNCCFLVKRVEKLVSLLLQKIQSVSGSRLFGSVGYGWLLDVARETAPIIKRRQTQQFAGTSLGPVWL